MGSATSRAPAAFGTAVESLYDWVKGKASGEKLGGGAGKPRWEGHQRSKGTGTNKEGQRGVGYNNKTKSAKAGIAIEEDTERKGCRDREWCSPTPLHSPKRALHVRAHCCAQGCVVAMALLRAAHATLRIVGSLHVGGTEAALLCVYITSALWAASGMAYDFVCITCALWAVLTVSAWAMMIAYITSAL
eukprot:scaffold233979_cov20-Tisochrysis_lutea.AAC.1